MSNSRGIPAHFTEPSATSPTTKPPPSGRGSAQGEFIISGSLTPSLQDTGTVQDDPATPATAMPGFHRRKKVQRMLKRWGHGMSFWGRILSSPSRGPWDDCHRFRDPHHTMFIK